LGVGTWSKDDVINIFEQRIEKYQTQLVTLYAGSTAPSFIEGATAISDLSNLQAEMGGYFETEEDTNRLWFRVHKFGSYAPFLVGWLLALSGNIFHVPGRGVED